MGNGQSACDLLGVGVKDLSGLVWLVEGMEAWNGGDEGRHGSLGLSGPWGSGWYIWPLVPHQWPLILVLSLPVGKAR